MKILSSLCSVYWFMRFVQYIGHCAEWEHPVFNYELSPITIGVALIMTSMYFLRDVME